MHSAGFCFRVIVATHADRERAAQTRRRRLMSSSVSCIRCSAGRDVSAKFEAADVDGIAERVLAAPPWPAVHGATGVRSSVQNATWRAPIELQRDLVHGGLEAREFFAERSDDLRRRGESRQCSFVRDELDVGAAHRGISAQRAVEGVERIRIGACAIERRSQARFVTARQRGGQGEYRGRQGPSPAWGHAINLLPRLFRATGAPPSSHERWAVETCHIATGRVAILWQPVPESGVKTSPSPLAQSAQTLLSAPPKAFARHG